MTELPPRYHEERRSSPWVTLSQVDMEVGHLPHTKNKARSSKGHIKATTTLLEDYPRRCPQPRGKGGVLYQDPRAIPKTASISLLRTLS